MTQALEIVQALAAPAALLDETGAPLAVNAAFLEAAPPAALIARLQPGDTAETLLTAGGLMAWRATALTGGRRLVQGAPRGGADARETYLAALSHELRTPLNGVLGMAALLAETGLTKAQQAYLASLRDCGEHLLSLVNDVLDLARLDAGKFALHPAPVDPRRLLQTVVELLSPRAYAKGLEIAWWTPAGTPQVMADEGRLRQILFNLAGNAVKFTERGGVALGLEVQPAAADRMRLRFTVTDTGPGVPAAERERIFEAFAQADPSHAARADSTGLGLAIVRRLTAAHAGQVGVDCPAEGGSQFWFEAEFQVAAAASAERPLAGHTVLIVSPSAIVGQACAGQAAAAGGEAKRADGLIQAQALARPGEVVLIDHALAQGAARPRPMPGQACVVLLAPEDRGEIEAYRADGFAGYLIKPLRAGSLVERVLAVHGETPALRDAPDERAGPAAVAGVKVLLVEDNPINALLARSLLEREGCSVDRVASGDAAVEAGVGGLFDVILMDVRMPGLSGREAARALRVRGCRTPIIAVTADAFEEDRRACLAAGMDDFITKPLEQPVLNAMLRRWARPDWTDAPTHAKLGAG